MKRIKDDSLYTKIINLIKEIFITDCGFLKYKNLLFIIKILNIKEMVFWKFRDFLIK